MKKTSFIALLLSFYALNAYSTTQITVFGDSLVAGYNLSPKDALPAQLEKLLVEDGYDVAVKNAGVSGDTTYAGLNRIDSAIRQKPEIIIIVLGGNDMLRAINPKTTLKNLDEIIKRCKDANIHVILTTMKASINYGIGFKNSFDSIYKNLSKKHSVDLAPFILENIIGKPSYMLSDGVHPNPAGVLVAAQELEPIVKVSINKVRE